LCGEGSAMTRPHTMEMWTGMYARLCSKALISFGRTHLCRVYKDVTCYPLFQEGAANAAGKVLSRHYYLCWLLGIVF
jgi:hypothetical protein